MQYHHTQRAPLHYLLWTISLIQVVAAYLLFALPVVACILIASAAMIALFAASFMHLTVQDEGHRLAIRFGPLPLFRKTINYEEIGESVAGRSSFIDGWGIHYVPRRGWTYNLWGFDCVELKVGEKRIRIGSDDVPNLVEFLNERIRASASPN